MKILVIGGSRFVGPFLVKKLLRRKHSLTLFNRGTMKSKYQKGITFIKGDRNRGFELDDRYDVVIDTCAYTGSQTKRAIKDLDFDYYINFGTAAVYKKTETFPLKETSPIGVWPLWGDYNKGKVECEEVLKKSKIKHATIRPVYILGPKNYIDRENFIYSKIKKGEVISLPGNGQAICQFTFARDVAGVLVFLAENKLAGEFNCASDDLITLQGLVETMSAIVGKKVKIEFDRRNDGEKFDPNKFPFANENFIVTNDKLKNLGIKFTPLLKGLKKDYRNYYQYQ